MSNKLKAVVLKVKVGEKFTFKGENQYFTRGRKYIIDKVSFDNGTSSTSVELIDDDYDTQTLSEKFFIKNFIKTVGQ